MNVNYGSQTFEYAKQKISLSANKLKNYIIIQVIFGIILIAIVVIAFLVVLGLTATDLTNINPNDLYQLVEDIVNNGIFVTTAGIIAAVFLIIAGIALVIIGILTYVQYYRLGQGFDKLNQADPSVQISKSVSYGFYGYIIAVIVGIFLPGIAGTIVSLIGNLSLAIAAYFIYQLFSEYQKQGRFNRTPSYMLVLGLGAQLITQIVSLFSYYGSFIGFVGFILMLIGFSHLSRDIKLVLPPGGTASQAQKVQQDSYAQAQPTAPVKQAGTTFCSHCGAKLTGDERFCVNCGAEV